MGYLSIINLEIYKFMNTKEAPMFGVITLITPKGGTGKSTLARSLGAHWSLTGHKPALVERVADVIEDLRARHAPVIVDTAGFRNRTAITALAACRTELSINCDFRHPITY